MVIPYKKKDLLHFVTEAVQECGWNVFLLNTEHPFRVKIYNEEESYQVKIIIYNLTHGGGHKRPKNEYRIQIKEPSIYEEQGCKTVILGYWAEMNVFAGFDIKKHIGEPGYSSSIQIKAENLQKSVLHGFSACDKGNGELAIAFNPNFFVEYVRNLEVLHAFGESKQDFNVLEKVTEQHLEINEEILNKVSKSRQVVVQTVSKKLRDNSFKSRILTAYNAKCAFSGMQLKLVEAAHIIPVSFDNSTDETSNGIALSALYHRAFDRGLVTINEKYQILINDNEVKKLKAAKLDSGFDKFEKNLLPMIHVPPAVNDRPNTNYIKEANILRGWNK